MKRFFIYSFVAAATLLAACNNDESQTAGADVISLRSTVANAATRANAGDALQNAQFQAGKDIFVEVYKTGESAAYTSGNYTTGEDGSMTGSLYYPADQKNIDVCAFYPASVNSGTTSFSVNASQTTADVANYQASDLMYADKLVDKAKGSTHALNFHHALTKIVVNLQADGAGMQPEDVKNMVSAVSINGMRPTANFAIEDGAVGAITASGTAADIDITGANKFNHVGIIVPQAVAAGTTLFTVTYNGNPFTYAAPADKTFVSGGVYTYNFTLSTQGIKLQSVSITDWDGTGDDKVINGGTLVLY